MAATLRVAWYRSRRTIGRRWPGYLAIVVLVALTGGIALASLAAARRTQSSFTVFLRSEHPSDITFPTALYGFQSSEAGYDPKAVAAVARIPDVVRVASAPNLNSAPLQPDGREFVPPKNAPANFELQSLGSVNGLYVDQDRVAVVAGRMLDPTRPNEMVLSPEVAQLLHAHVGSVLRFGFYTNAQEAAPGPSGDVWRPHAHLTENITVAGLARFDSAIVQDDIDAVASNFALFSPALTARLTACCASSSQTGVVLAHGARDLPGVERSLAKLNPVLASHFNFSSINEAKAERAVEPESIALGVFGAIAALAALLLGGQVIGRELRSGLSEREVLRALGAGPATTTTDGLLGTLAAVVVGALGAGALAFVLSPLAPLGPVRSVYPERGFSFDWTMLGFGVLALVVGLGAFAAVIAYRNAPHRVARRARLMTRRTPLLSRVAATSGSAPLTTGVRFATEPGRRTDPVPVRSAILGAVLATMVMVATLTFASSLHALVSRPALYGWNWNVELTGGGGVGAVPAQLVANDLRNDHDVEAFSGVYFAGATINGTSVPVLAVAPNAPVAPPLLSGHGVDGADEIVLGGTTLSQLHAHLGETVSVDTGAGHPVPLRIVGTASMPAIGASGGGNEHLEMGTGALLDVNLVPPTARDPSGNQPTGPNAVLVRYRAHTNPATDSAALQRVAQELSLPTNWGVNVTTVQRPAEIVNYRSMNATPLYLGVGLALAAVTALGLTLIASVRRRRHDLALLKTLGFTRRQLAAVIAWQSTIAVAIGAVVGVPLGVIVGRSLWTLFAEEIHVVARPSVPALAIGILTVGALVAANILAAIPGRQAARTRTAVLLRAE